MLSNHLFLSWQDWAANACYLILAVSYLVTDLYWLRLLAIVSLGLEGLYFYYGSNPPLWVGIGWAIVFVTINVVQLALLTRERLTVRLSDQEQQLYAGLFGSLTDVQFNRLLKAGHWREFEDASPLTVRGNPVPELLLIGTGSVRVTVGAEIIAVQKVGSFVGEMSFMSGESATATVTALGSVTALAISRNALDRLMVHDHQFGALVLRLIGHDLIEKMRVREISIE